MRFVTFITAALLTAGILPVYAAAPTAEGGSTQAGAQPGCMNQWLFDGVWRVRVTNVAFEPKGDRPAAWAVTMQWGNGTSYAGITPTDTRVQDMVLALANGDTLTATDTTTGNLTQQKLFFHSFPASGQYTHVQQFYGDTLDENNKPAKLLITFDIAGYRKANPNNTGKFWKQKTPGYNYRVDLTCTK